MRQVLKGYARRFGSNVNTDYIIAAQYKAASLDMKEMARHTFEDIDPGFVHRVQNGDILVAGDNFGCGSSRETAVHVLKECGISAVVAPSFGRIFFRNAINNGLPALECDTREIEEGDHLSIDSAGGEVTVAERSISLTAAPLPAIMRALLDEGGLLAYLKKHGDFPRLEDHLPGNGDDAHVTAH